MGYTLAEFCADARRILRAEAGDAARAQVAARLASLLVDRRFVSEHFDPQIEAGQRTLHRDAEAGFHVLAHHQRPGRQGAPHDHGASWAIYGVARGYTVMTEWRRLDDGKRAGHARIEPAGSYRLDVGDTAAYGPHVIHNTHHPEGAWVVRVTGGDLEAIPRNRFVPERNEVKVTTRAGAEAGAAG
jgi:predicted metal-dependent enzyme (double-stranded beta helix superfamily)